jgi:hypothetical protein
VVMMNFSSWGRVGDKGVRPNEPAPCGAGPRAPSGR